MSRMSHRVAVALAVSIALLSVVALPAQKKDDKKAQEGAITPAQRQELSPVVTLVDEVMKGTAAGTYAVAGPTAKEPAAPQAQAAPGDVPLTWKNDFLKAQNGLIYVPFTVSVEPGKLTTSSVIAYLRVAARGTKTPPTPPGASAEKSADKDKADKDKADKDKADKDKKDELLYPFEDVYFTDLRGGTAAQPQKLTRAFAVPPGDYDVYVALRERGVAAAPAAAAPAAAAPPAAGTPAAAGATGAAPAPSATPAPLPEGAVRVVVLKQELTVPNYHGDELQTSSVIVADRIEQLSAPLQGDAAKERPYVLGDAEIVPAQDLKFKKSEEINVVFQVYGVKFGDDKKPDVTVEYAFFQKDPAAGEKPFNKTPPQAFNGQTLPPNFDPAQGHQIVGGQAVPLATFPDGDFRLEVKITDNKAGKSITRDVTFSVVPAS